MTRLAIPPRIGITPTAPHHEEHQKCGADQQPKIAFHEFPAATDTSSDVDGVVSREDLRGECFRVDRAHHRRRRRARAGAAERGGELGNFRQRFPFGTAFGQHLGLRVGAAFLNPLMHLLDRDRAVLATIRSDDFIHVVSFALCPCLFYGANRVNG